ncbi:hypothetical protein QEG31_005379, partial [Pluralibacter gergoviae]
KLVEVGFGFKAFGQFSRKGFKFLFVHRLPVSVVGVNISKTGNYTILITVSICTAKTFCFGLGSELTGTYQPDNTAEFFMGG